MDKSKPYPPGMQKFHDSLPSKVFNKGCDDAWLYCQVCNRPMSLAAMNVFVYPDHPEYTTKALCQTCIKQEAEKVGINLENKK